MIYWLKAGWKDWLIVIALIFLNLLASWSNTTAQLNLLDCLTYEFPIHSIVHLSRSPHCFVSWDIDLLIYRDRHEWKYMKCLIFWTADKDMKVEIISILIETGGLFNLEPEYIVEKCKYKKLEIMQPRIKNKAELPVV